MGKDSIEKGSKDAWTMYPRRLQAMKDEIAKGQKVEAGDPRMAAGGRAQNVVPLAQYEKLAKRPEWRDRRLHLPANRRTLTATKFVNALIRTASPFIATTPFTAGGKRTTGSWVVKTARAFRPHVLDMFEPQDHPDDFPYPGAAPTPPYDNAGWTLAYQMGWFDRILAASMVRSRRSAGCSNRRPARWPRPRERWATSCRITRTMRSLPSIAC
jgi:hypothetical protein